MVGEDNVSKRTAWVVMAFVLTVSVAPRGAVADLLVQNGGFETGDFTDWALASIDPGTKSLPLDTNRANVNHTAAAPPSNYGAQLGPQSPGAQTSGDAAGPYTLSQTFSSQTLGALSLGETLTLSFDLAVSGVSPVPTNSGGQLVGFQVSLFGENLLTPNSSTVNWKTGYTSPLGTPLDQLDYITTATAPGKSSYSYGDSSLPYQTTFSFSVDQTALDYIASNPVGPSLQFAFLDDAGYFYLDNVQVTSPTPPQAIPEPTTLVLCSIAGGVGVVTRRLARRSAGKWHR